EGFPVVLGGPAYERTTPTGAALLAAVAMPAPDGWTAVPVKTGVGVGTLDPPQLPNLLRAVWCRQSPGDGPGGGETAWVNEWVEQAEANLDDANPEWLGYLMERLLEAGALDVAYTPAQMKKNRPGTCIQVVYPPALRAGMLELLFAESTTLGVRYQLLSRAVAARRGVVVHTPWGPVAGKAAKIPAGRGNSVWRFSPEFDSASRAARQGGVPLQQVYRAAQRAYEELQPAPDED
ncbi:MAG: LarC family nickel insertion protein, partial [Deltaproteobacteria bacterium]|nr:LarC family nickel insertion protein [Deltaproteobacteria bacterium]